MKPKDIQLDDLHRILFGEIPPAFLIEVFVRILFLTVMLIVTIRLMGKRMSSQLSLQEMAILISLAAAIGIPMQDPSRGLLPAVIIAILAIVIHRLVAWLSMKYKKIELLSQGDVDLLVREGVIDFGSLKKNGLTKENVVGQLRYAGIKNLGKVKRLYIETSGAFTVVSSREKKPGLTLIPFEDPDLLAKQRKSVDHFCCFSCGLTVNGTMPSFSCGNCGNLMWINATE